MKPFFIFLAFILVPTSGFSGNRYNNYGGGYSYPSYPSNPSCTRDGNCGGGGHASTLAAPTTQPQTTASRPVASAPSTETAKKGEYDSAKLGKDDLEKGQLGNNAYVGEGFGMMVDPSGALAIRVGGKEPLAGKEGGSFFDLVYSKDKVGYMGAGNKFVEITDEKILEKLKGIWANKPASNNKLKDAVVASLKGIQDKKKATEVAAAKEAENRKQAQLQQQMQLSRERNAARFEKSIQEGTGRILARIEAEKGAQETVKAYGKAAEDVERAKLQEEAAKKDLGSMLSEKLSIRVGAPKPIPLDKPISPFDLSATYSQADVDLQLQKADFYIARQQNLVKEMGEATQTASKQLDAAQLAVSKLPKQFQPKEMPVLVDQAPSDTVQTKVVNEEEKDRVGIQILPRDYKSRTNWTESLYLPIKKINPVK